MNLPLLIVSFHRSGSSMTAQLFHAAGLHLGDRLLGAKPSNPYGHFEDEEIVRFHDAILASVEHAWYKDRGFLSDYSAKNLSWIISYALKKTLKHRAFGVKDPRLCLTARHWYAALGDIRIVFVHRSAHDCCASFWSRALKDLRAGAAPQVNGPIVEDPDLTARIYIHNVNSFLSFYDALPDARSKVIFVAYDDIVRGVDLVGKVRRKWGYPLQDADIEELFDADAVTIKGGMRLKSQSEPLVREMDALDNRLFALCEES